jgi:hypothetical protein
MASATSDHTARAAQNQALCRAVNERIEALQAGSDVTPALHEFLCECADTGCTAAIQMTVEEYEAVRTDPSCFAVAPLSEHVVPHVEEVVARHERYWTVKKVGQAAQVAARLDPRSD